MTYEDDMADLAREEYLAIEDVRAARREAFREAAQAVRDLMPYEGVRAQRVLGAAVFAIESAATRTAW